MDIFEVVIHLLHLILDIIKFTLETSNKKR